MSKTLFFFSIIFGKECTGNKFTSFKINSVVYKKKNYKWSINFGIKNIHI